jgi:ferredoxin
MDEDDCLVDIAKFYLGFCVEESCGKCAPCRIGGTQMLRLLEKISEGKGALEDLTALRRIAFAMQKASLCGLGQTAANPVLSTLRYFENEYKEHIVNRRCPSQKCAKLANFTIIQDVCKRCGLCQKHCPAGAIPGNREEGYVIKQDVCVKCGQCYEVCKFKAIAKG